MIYVIIRGIKKIVRFTVDFVIIDVRYIEVLLAGYSVYRYFRKGRCCSNNKLSDDVFRKRFYDTLVQFSPNNRNSISK